MFSIQFLFIVLVAKANTEQQQQNEISIRSKRFFDFISIEFRWKKVNSCKSKRKCTENLKHRFSFIFGAIIFATVECASANSTENENDDAYLK